MSIINALIGFSMIQKGNKPNNPCEVLINAITTSRRSKGKAPINKISKDGISKFEIIEDAEFEIIPQKQLPPPTQ